jgi:hypothetical protein
VDPLPPALSLNQPHKQKLQPTTSLTTQNKQTQRKTKTTPLNSYQKKKHQSKNLNKPLMASPCPIPAVSHVLQPYIQPRPSVSATRQSLHSHLERQLRLETTQTLSLANVADPPLTQTLPEPPVSLTGVRRAYWRALRAHQVARERYEGLRAELDVASRSVGMSDGGDGDGEELLALLRARERRRRLGVIGRTVEEIEAEGRGVVGAKIDDVVRKSVGDVPVLPGQKGGLINGGGGREEGEMRVVELKKAILRARATIESSEKLQQEASEGGKSELYALQQARNELISWIEAQLSLIGDAQAEETNTPSSPIKNPHDDSEEIPIASAEEISQLYDRYISARHALLATIQQPHDISPLAPAPSSPIQTRKIQETDPSTTTASAILPFISPLLTTQSAEQALIRQAAFVRRQLAASDSSFERQLRRLADESHLVQPGASRGKDWVRAGEEVGEATRGYVLAKAKAGERASREADGLLGRLEGVTGGLERLVASQ